MDTREISEKLDTILGEVKKLQEELWAIQPTGICDICQLQLHKENKKLRLTLDAINNIVKSCETCNVEPPAMRFKCSECQENMITSIKETISEGVK